MQFKYLCHENTYYVTCFVSRLDWNKMSLFGEHVHHHHDWIMPHYYSLQPYYEIYRNKFPIPFGYGKMLQQPCLMYTCYFDLLELIAPRYILYYIFLHTMLEILLHCCYDCILIFWAPWVWIMVYFIHCFLLH